MPIEQSPAKSLGGATNPKASTSTSRGPSPTTQVEGRPTTAPAPIPRSAPALPLPRADKPVVPKIGTYDASKVVAPPPARPKGVDYQGAGIDNSAGDDSPEVFSADEAQPGDEAKAAAAVVEPVTPAPVVDEKAKPKPFEIPGAKKEDAKARDYAGLDEETAAILKALPNGLYDKVKDRVPKLLSAEARLKELEPKLAELDKRPNFFHEHPQAYVLDPEYGKLREDVHYDHSEYNHYLDQLAKIKRGEPWDIITNWDAQGNPVVKTIAAPKDGTVDTAAEVRIGNALVQVQSKIQQGQAAIQKFEQTYQADGKRSAAELQHVEDTLFPGDTWKPETFNAEEKEMYDASLSLLPKNMQKLQVGRINAKAGVAVLRINRYAKSLEQKLAIAEAKLKGNALAEPSPTGAAGASAAGDYSLED